MTLVEGYGTKIHDLSCFHLKGGTRGIYKGLFPNATEQQAREFIIARKLVQRCCGSCLAKLVRE